MYEPPDGRADLQSDSELAEFSPHFAELEVPGVGVVWARKPMPNAAHVLDSLANADVPNSTRLSQLSRFVRNHLADGEFRRITTAMIDDEDDAYPPDAVQRIARAIATWGTARPTRPSSRCA